MERRKILAIIGLGIVAWLAMPAESYAAQTTVYGAKEISKIGDKLKDFMFNVAVPYAGGIFGGINTIKSFMANNYQAMGVFALLTASSFVVPHFLDGVFGSSMLLP